MHLHRAIRRRKPYRQPRPEARRSGRHSRAVPVDRYPCRGVNNQGCDHWPACYSALLAGAGVRGGLVYGASDKQGAHVRDNPISPEKFSATIYRALGIDPGTRLGLDGFTRPASAGQSVQELFG